jgi:hypothetical protein
MKLSRKAIGGIVLTASMVVTSASTAFAGVTANAGVSSVLYNIVEEHVAAAQATQVQESTSGDSDSSAYDWTKKVLANVEDNGNVNVREEASADSEAVGKLRASDAADIVEQGEEWTLISSGNVKGYVRNDLLLFGEDAKAAAEERGTVKVTVEATTLKVREEATDDAKVAGLAAKGDVLIAAKNAEDTDGWVAVTYDDAKDNVAYVSEEYVDTELVLGKAITTEEEAEMKAAEEKAKKEAEEAAKAKEETSDDKEKEESNDSTEDSSSASTAKSSTTAQSSAVSVQNSTSTQSTAASTQSPASSTQTSSKKNTSSTSTNTSTQSTDQTSSTASQSTQKNSSSSSLGGKLTKRAGVYYGPSGKESYYNLDMSGVVSTMRSLGYTGEYAVRSDGVKTLGGYVMVAADLNTYPKGTLVSTSLGTGIVCDTGGFVYNGSGVVFDIATNW